ncbi:tRNA (guanosine(37)-N1)-methyltransferase TrmD [Candidatus Uhrbacteria bacterium]|nr:tRNA (guanosine(37)-N1)-methyltransferase TrmD [Candidatus Uhrbacteria bacterium]
MQFDIVTIFPEAFASYFDTSILKRAQKKKLVDIRVHNLRDYTTDKHKTVDDNPYGGGAGMVLKVEPLYRAVSAIQKKAKSRKRNARCILLAASGKQFDQRMAEKFSKLDQIIFICGHYEGVDERVMEFVDEAVSVGPYVLTGGELPTMTIVDAVTRLIPGVLGNPRSLEEESFSITESKKHRITESQKNLKSRISNLKSAMEYPHYTRPESFSPRKGVHWKVPRVLLGGNHQKIKEWREKHMK